MYGTVIVWWLASLLSLLWNLSDGCFYHVPQRLQPSHAPFPLLSWDVPSVILIQWIVALTLTTPGQYHITILTVWKSTGPLPLVICCWNEFLFPSVLLQGSLDLLTCWSLSRGSQKNWTMGREGRRPIGDNDMGFNNYCMVLSSRGVHPPPVPLYKPRASCGRSSILMI